MVLWRNTYRRIKARSLIRFVPSESPRLLKPQVTHPSQICQTKRDLVIPTSRALATYILSTGGYNLRGFNSMEEYYVSDLTGYYENIQMDLPVLYYEGRNNPTDLAPWIGYFTRIMAYAFDQVASTAKRNSRSLVHPLVSKLEPKELVLLRALLQRNGIIKPKEIAELFHVTGRTATNWTKLWLEKGLLDQASGDRRITSYCIGAQYAGLSPSDLGYVQGDG